MLREFYLDRKMVKSVYGLESNRHGIESWFLPFVNSVTFSKLLLCFLCCKIGMLGTFLGSLVVRTLTARGQVRSPVGELKILKAVSHGQNEIFKKQAC